MLIASQRIGEKPSDERVDVVTAPGRLMRDEEISLMCWKCARVESLDLSCFKNGLFRLSDVARRIGWVSGFDFKRGRVLAFCSKKCKKEAKGRRGYFGTICLNKPRAAHRRKGQGVSW